MFIGGGWHCFVGYITYDNSTAFYNLINPEAVAGEVEIVISYQESEYSAQQCVGIDVVLVAANTFAKIGKIDRSVHWQQE